MIQDSSEDEDDDDEYEDESDRSEDGIDREINMNLLQHRLPDTESDEDFGANSPE